MILQIQTANKAQLVASFKNIVTIYVRQYGAGNLRIGPIKEDLENTAPTVVAPGQVQDGIPQAAAGGVQQYFWSGDLWAISDVAGPAMFIFPSYVTYIDRQQNPINPSNAHVSQEGGNLSTYQ
jgi:hypothetical protein